MANDPPRSPGPAAPASHPTAPESGTDFIRTVIADDLRDGVVSTVVTRFPPEPNGYLHIGHAKSIALNFGIANEVPGGRCHLRFDDTNPETEDEHYVRSIIDSVRWLGYDWGDHLYFASDYFAEMYEFAEHLIRQGLAYVDRSTEEQIREARGTVTEPGRPTPDRSRSADENLDLFRRMRAGEFPDGSHVLRAKIDLAAPNMLLRDPVLYRIRHAHHYRTGDEWCIYPLYDFAHPIEDGLECVTHSFCTLEFENNRPLYNWVVENIPVECRPRQYEFARGNLDYTVMSKRKLLELVRGGFVSGWDDPRIPTLAGLRRRGVTPEAIRSFWDRMGIAKAESRADIGKLEYAIRDDLNQKAPRVLCVLRPLRVVITNYPAEGQTEELEAPYWPHDVPREGTRMLPFGRVLYVERDDFAEQPSEGWFRLAPGAEVRLRYAYIIRCDEVVRDADGNVTELRCSYDPSTRGGAAPEGKTIRGTLHWVSAERSLPCEVRLYDRLFSVPDPDRGEADFKTYLNPDSLEVLTGSRIEPSVAADPPDTHYQFERQGYFWQDPVDSRPGALVFNRTVTLRDAWAKAAKLAGADEQKPSLVQNPEEKQQTDLAPERVRTPAAPSLPDRSPELEERRTDYAERLGLATEEADILSRELATVELFEAALESAASPRAAANWIIHELPREIGDRTRENLPFGGRALGQLAALVENGTLSSSAGREVLAEMVRTGEAPEGIVARRGLQQISDSSQLAPVVEQVLTANPAKAEEYRGGKLGLLGFFVGQVMRATGGKANPELAKQMLEERLTA